LVAQLDRALAS